MLINKVSACILPAWQKYCPVIKIGTAAFLWWLVYTVLQPITEFLTFDLLRLPRGSPLGEAVAFFFYDVPKILLLLGGMIFLITLLRTFFGG
jgi:hypothetical protein